MLRQKAHTLINSKVFTKCIYVLIVLNIIAIILESYKELRVQFGSLFYVFEVFSVIVFTLEYILRLWISEKKLKFVFSTFGLIDLLAVLPFYLPFLFVFDFRFLRILRLFRMLRVFKLGRYSNSIRLISSVLKETRAELAMTIFIAFILLVFSSTLMYYVENDVQPEKFASIGHAFWWAIATLTTIGYGDVYPITGLGKVLSAVIALIGIGFVALPTGIISSAFIERIKQDKKEECKCPHCGKKLK